MNCDEALRLLKGGPKRIAEWNRRRLHGEPVPELKSVSLRKASLLEANLSRVNFTLSDLFCADFRGCNLEGAKFLFTTLVGAKFEGANLAGSDLRRAFLYAADFTRANLSKADLSGTDLSISYSGAKNFFDAILAHRKPGVCFCNAILEGADLTDSRLSGVDFRDAKLKGAKLNGAVLDGVELAGGDLSGAQCRGTIFSEVDLSVARGLDLVEHVGPSRITTKSLTQSRGKIPEAFLRGCGLAPWEVLLQELYIPKLTAPALSDLQRRIFDGWTKGKSMLNGCFISYSRKDARMVDKLRERLLSEGIMVWLDRHDAVAGPIESQIWRAIQIHHVVIILLSKYSVESDWVDSELQMAREREKKDSRAILCPIALDDAWKAKVGPGVDSRHLWRTLQQKNVIDFSKWKTPKFDVSFQKLMRGLNENYGPR